MFAGWKIGVSASSFRTVLVLLYSEYVEFKQGAKKQSATLMAMESEALVPVVLLNTSLKTYS